MVFVCLTGATLALMTVLTVFVCLTGATLVLMTVLVVFVCLTSYLGLDDWFHDNFLCCMYSWSSSQFLYQFVELLCDFLWFEFECFGCFGLLGYNLGFNDGFCVFSWCYLGLDDGFGGFCVFNWCYLGLDDGFGGLCVFNL